jgi:hypothetical protein
MYALDVGRTEELKARYGGLVEAAGFRYSDRIKPAVLFRPEQPDRHNAEQARQ